MPAQTNQTTQNRYYFDRDYLLQYLDQKVKTRVLVDGRYLDISDTSDLEDEFHGVGYDNNGNPKFFDYRSIKQVKAGGEMITLDQLQQSQSTPEQKPEEEPVPTDEEPPAEDAAEPEEQEGEPPTDGEEPPKEKPEKDSIKSHYDPYMIGRSIIAESMKKQPKKEINKIVRILEHPFYNVTGVVTEVYADTYEIRPLSGRSGRIEIQKKNVKFV